MIYFIFVVFNIFVRPLPKPLSLRSNLKSDGARKLLCERERHGEENEIINSTIDFFAFIMARNNINWHCAGQISVGRRKAAVSHWGR